MHWDVGIAMRDGTRLAGTLYLPAKHLAPTPAIVAMTPYIGQVCHEQAVYFAAHGYPFVAVDVRGRGNSQGVFHPLNEIKDSHDVVQWLATQPFCDGKVAMWGGSYSGYVQWAATKELASNLRTIVPVAAPFRGGDSPLRNNIFSPYTVQWLTLIAGRALQDKIFADRSFWSAQFAQWFASGSSFKALDALLGNPSPIFQEWLSHPHRDEYWDGYNPTAQEYARVSIPVLTVTGIYDANQLGSLMHYRAHLKHCSPAARKRHYLVIGPWDHAGTRVPRSEFAGLKVGPASLVDLPKLHRQWYAWTMQGAPRPEFLKNNVVYYVMVAERWCYADSLESVTARIERLYLHSTRNPTDVFMSGSLCAELRDCLRPDEYRYDPRDVRHIDLEREVDQDNLVDQRLLHAMTGRLLIYHSASCAQAREIAGFFRLSLWLSIDQPDTDFHVSIYDVAADGSAVRLGADTLRARYRESPYKQRLIETRDALRYDFEHFPFVARRIEAGHRLRLVIGALNSIHWQKNYNSGGDVSEETLADARPVTVRLFHDASRPSALEVPFGQLEC